MRHRIAVALATAGLLFTPLAVAGATERWGQDIPAGATAGVSFAPDFVNCVSMNGGQYDWVYDSDRVSFSWNGHARAVYDVARQAFTVTGPVGVHCDARLG